MDIVFACTAWGSRFGSNPCSSKAWLHEVKEAGYDAVEVGAPQTASERKDLVHMLADADLQYVAQQWTHGESASIHSDHFEEQYRNALELNPLLVNSHTGRDIFSLDDNLSILTHAQSVEESCGVPVVHETHRGRWSFSGPGTKAVLDAMPTVKLAADFSHWCCVHESLLEDQDATVAQAVQHAYHVHARVGFSQGPQVPHPAAPEWTEVLERHLSWWDAIIAARTADGTKTLVICPEFGPQPYMPTVPFTQQSIADQWQINVWMLNLLKKRYLA